MVKDSRQRHALRRQKIASVLPDSPATIRLLIAQSPAGMASG